MTQEEKQLLFKDLCARLPYEVKCADFTYNEYGDIVNTVETLETIIPSRQEYKYVDIYSTHDISRIKPYLRPMSSMTEEEEMEVKKFGVSYDKAFHNDIYDTGISMEEAFTAISWFLERHFDINYLIEKGLALEAPEGMYKTE